MKKLLLEAIVFAMAFALCACGINGTDVESAIEEPPVASSDVAMTEEPVAADDQGSVDLIGPWHLDSEKNDLTAFQDIFSAYAEFGASMEIRSNGQISWYIGAEGGSGTFTQDGDTLTAEIVSDLDQQPVTVTFHVILDGETAQLEMDYNGTNVCWVYGDTEDPSAAGE